MAIPTFTLTAGPEGFNNIVFPGDDGPLTSEALAGLVVTFTPNIRPGEMVEIDGGLHRVPAFSVTLDENGKLNGNDGISMLANLPGLDKQMQWTLSFKSFRINGYSITFTKWTFNAPEDGATVSLDELVPVPGMVAQGVTRGEPGADGAPVDSVQPSDDNTEAEFFVQGDKVGSVPIPGALFGSIGGDPASQPNIVGAAPKSRTKQPVVCFIFDDCPAQDVTDVIPILNDYAVKAGFAIPSAYPGLAGLLTWGEIRTHIRDGGHEVLSHTINHSHLDTFADPDMSLANTLAQINNKAAYAAQGITVRGHVYAFGEHNSLIRRLVREHYEYAFGTTTNGASGSQEPLSTYAIRRIALKDSTVTATHLAQVDTAKANGEILCFIIHSNPTANEFTLAGGGHQRLRDVIEHCIDEDVPILPPGEAFDLIRNTLDLGDFPGGTAFAVFDSEGKPHLPETADSGVAVLESAGDALTKTPAAFDAPLTLQKYTSSSGAPGSGPGTVQTVKVDSSGTVGGLNYQLYFRNGSNGIYVRHGLSDNTGWTSWTQVGGGTGVSLLAASTSAIGTLPSAYSAGITVQAVISTASPATPRPDNGPGVLRTVITVAGSGTTTGNLNFQEFIGSNGFGVWVRAAANDNGSWGSWYSTTSVQSGSITSSATPQPFNANGHDYQLNVNALAVGATFAAPQAGAPVDGQEVTLRIKDNGSSQTLAFNSIYRFPTAFPAPTATVSGQVLTLTFRYNSTDSKYDYVSGSLTPASGTDIAATVHAATAKTVPVSADEFALVDSAAGNVLKRITYADVLAAVNSTITDRESISVGESTIPRGQVVGTTTLSTGILRLGYFQALKSETVTQVRVTVTTAQTSATICRCGIYSIDGSNNLTLVASTTNDTTWLNATGSTTKALTASWNKVAGTRYAVAVLYVGGGTAPIIMGANNIGADEMAVAPRLIAAVAGQTDLPASVSAGSLLAGTQRPYVALLP